MTQWNLSRMRNTVRKITGKLDPSQIPDSSNSSIAISPTNQPGIDDFINDFYLYDLDEHLRLLPLRVFYKFNTVPNVGTYSLPSNLSLTNPAPVYFQAEPPIYCDGYEIGWYQQPQVFYNQWAELKTVQTGIATGSGATTYTFTLSGMPILQGTVVIGTQNSATPGVVNESFSDSDADGFINSASTPAFTNPGTLTSSIGGTGTGTINYLTGAVSVTFSNAIPTGTNINAHYYAYVASRPTGCLFYNQQFKFKPVPNDVYEIKVLAYQQPTALLAAGGVSTQFSNFNDAATYNEWWQLIAYGAAIKIFIEDGDHEEASSYKQYFEEAKLLAQRRTLKVLAQQKILVQNYNSGGQNGYWPYPPVC